MEKIQRFMQIALFQKFKRNSRITITLKIKDKISKPDFIKVMADGMEGDIIQFYTDEIYSSFISDPQKIKEDIYNQVYKNVYGHLPLIEEIEDDIGIELVKVKTNEEIGIKTEIKINETKQKSEKEIILIPGKPTKGGKITFKYLNKKGKVVDLMPETAKKKGYKVATEKDITTNDKR